MGRIFDRFGCLEFHNEDEVSQNLLLPLLTDFLGYSRDEILPEYMVLAFDIPQNRLRSISTEKFPPKARPDFVVTLDRQHQVFVCESKGPDENLNDHLDQLIAYCIALRTNLLLVTNGSELRVYDANCILIECSSIDELDLKFNELHKLLNRADVAQRSVIERIQTLDLSHSLNKNLEVLRTEQLRRVAIALSDFHPYLQSMVNTPLDIELPAPIREALNCRLERFPAEDLYSFRDYGTGSAGMAESRIFSYSTLRGEASTLPVVIVGESGIGKTSLLQQVCYDQASLCLQYETDVVPVLVKLGHLTRSRGLFDLIADSLLAKGARTSPAEIPSLLREGRLALLLDAFDEVLEDSVPDAERELRHLTESYPRTRVWITTRHFRLPRLSIGRRYAVQPLSDKKIEAFAGLYLGSEDSEFLSMVTERGLQRLASNTLVLTFLVLLYASQGSLPSSRGRILAAVVNCVREWDQAKPERFTPPISWRARERLLRALAFAAMSIGESYRLDQDLVQSAIGSCVRELEAHREIAPALTQEQILRCLAATGFVNQTRDGVVFWHRAFVEYFAAFEVAAACERDPQLLDSLVEKPEWQDVLSMAATKASDPAHYVRRLLDHTIFGAAQALKECDLTENDVHWQVADALVARCHSDLLPIRRKAMKLFAQLEGHRVDKLLWRLLDSDFVDVQKAALLEMARRKTTGSRQAVFSRLDWNPPDTLWIDGPGGIAVLEALGEFDDEEAHLQIVSLVRDRPNVFTKQSCIVAFKKIASRVQPSAQVVQALLDMFLSEDKPGHPSFGELSQVLITLKDRRVAADLIAALKEPNAEKHLAWKWGISEILASYDQPEIVEDLIAGATDRSLSSAVRDLFARSLSESRGQVPLPVLMRLVEDDDDHVRAAAIRGLGRFPFAEVQTVVLRAVHPPPWKESSAAGHTYAHVQAAALEMLARFHKLELLLKEENQPEYFFSNSLGVLFDVISSGRVSSMLPLLAGILDRTKHASDQVKVAWVLADLGHIREAQKVIEEIMRERSTRAWVALDIVCGVYRLPGSYAAGVVDEIMANCGELEPAGASGELKELCIEAYGAIGTAEACDRLARIASDTAEDETGNDANLALRSMELLAPREREQWLTDLVRSRPKMQPIVLRRALELLGFIGGEDSVPLLSEHLSESRDPVVRRTCFWALHGIHRRSGRLWFNDEEKPDR